MDVVSICKRKRPLGRGRWMAYTWCADSYGTWLFTPAHSIFVSDDGAGHIGTCEVAQDNQLRGRHSLVLLPATGWFVAHWVLNDHHLVSFDISTPPTRSGAEWSFEDLELDPFVLQDGTFGVEDEDEFVAACRAGLITHREREESRSAVEFLRQELTGMSSPLMQAGRDPLVDAVQLDLAPLVTAAAI